jgi:hypothetical protein
VATKSQQHWQDAPRPSTVLNYTLAALPAYAVTAVSVLQGQPVYVDPITGGVSLSKVLGLAFSDVAAGYICSLADTLVNRSDWTPITGTATLTAGATYFLDTSAGMLTTTPPSTVGQVVVKVGIAVSNTILEIEISQGILL